MNNINELLHLLPHIHPDDLKANWFNEPILYPQYQKIGNILQPQTILEIGCRLGYSLISLMDGSNVTTDIQWYDNESYIAESNKQAKENIEHYCQKYNKNISMKYSNNKDDILKENAPPFDIVHIDGDHSFKGALYDLMLTNKITPTMCIIVHDFSWTDINDAVNLFCSANGYNFLTYPMHNLAAIIDTSPNNKIYKILKQYCPVTT